MVSGSSGRTRSRFTEIMLPQSPIFTSTPYNIGVAWFDLHDSKKHLINKQLKTEDTKKLIKKRGLTASFFTLRVWHWYIADGVRALSSSALPLNPARLNSLTYIIYDKDKPTAQMNTKFKNQMKLQPKKGVTFTYFSISSTRNHKLVRGFRDELGTEYVGSVPRLYRMHKLSTGVIPNINLRITN